MDCGLSVHTAICSSRPKLLTRDELHETFDAVILSCKAYDLDAAMDDIAPAVGAETLLLPLLNGVAHIERLTARSIPGKCSAAWRRLRYW